ncbi:helix-turn-helix transcriptional regulator [Actinomadura sp. WMMB 499]|uniref:helix-turn-helix domain-containing protein n=1 Tax=Actinomadura sp. WMMB 499 TaxID=1219491 RepID=UPI00124780F9|nr:helix-turn-helix transcriptional regulator [Actinomadura sp. WMMB 499]QFG23383.1 helix-turn-helix domain-containing protein [Actinomadura sp. WMMB 499]
MATKRTSPTVRRRRLAAILRQLRKDAKKTREEAAEFAGISPVTISRIEAAAHNPKPGDIAMLCKFYGLDDQVTDELVALARQCRIKGWWQQYDLPDIVSAYTGLEEEAATIQQYSVDVIPGLLQTEAYIQAVAAAELRAYSEEEVNQAVTVRVTRQERLGVQDPLTAWFVLNEDAIRRQVGGTEVMRGQLHHLLTMSRADGVELQVLPFDAGAHPAIANGAFTVLGFPEQVDPDVVYIELRMGSVYLEKPAEIDTYLQLFNQLRARALGPGESRSMIEEVIASLT